jgi:predicted nuclease of predicted toxin-antitoxin system
MKILIDECVPRKFKHSLVDHHCQTVPEAGLAGKENGELLSIAETRGFEVFLTIDKGFVYEQSLVGRAIAVLILRAKSTLASRVCARSKLAKLSESAAKSLFRPGRLSSPAIALFHDLFAAVAGSAFSFSCASALYGLFTEAASVNAAFASGKRFRLSSANPSRYWLRA